MGINFSQLGSPWINSSVALVYRFLVSKEAVVLRR